MATRHRGGYKGAHTLDQPGRQAPARPMPQAEKPRRHGAQPPPSSPAVPNRPRPYGTAEHHRHGH
ncbi:hypothetical protein ABZ543_09765, partial [Streptomyces roseifaciens]